MTDNPKTGKPEPDVQLADVAKLWDDHPGWGTPNDYAVTIDQLELEGFKVGQTVRVVEDCDSDDDIALEGGDEGVVIGVYHLPAGLFNPNPRSGLVVWLEGTGMDPVGLTPDQVEHQ